MSAAARYTLDASALLAYLQGEPASMLVQAALADGAFMKSVNYAEVLCRLSDAGEDPAAADRRIHQQGLIGGMVQIVPVGADDAVTNAQLRVSTRPYGLSLGDRVCLATGLRIGPTRADRRPDVGDAYRRRDDSGDPMMESMVLRSRESG